MRKLLGSRYELSLILIAGSFVLLVAIVVGNSMGNRVLGQIASRASFATTPVPIPTASVGDEASEILNRRRQVLSVATDPAFPDPRVTPEPPPPATPKPVVATARPEPSPTDPDDGGTPDPADDVTAPPMPAPQDSSSPGDQASPQDANAPSRGYPSLPPTNPTP